ncbi:hypothetical protein BS47DRAFT_519644 [Hydnum rufescens UP504]|uniref:Uncharacterized protein n=1 Tax=Hydnum rufescens UP504 TaxID=1448309 RepID=A0A9P6DL68_9AGAM|nr:hypothetical protein BS47DRAFT_519644 [Hydnum rufescens UP504]
MLFATAPAGGVFFFCLSYLFFHVFVSRSFVQSVVLVLTMYTSSMKVIHFDIIRISWHGVSETDVELAANRHRSRSDGWARQQRRRIFCEGGMRRMTVLIFTRSSGLDSAEQAG